MKTLLTSLLTLLLSSVSVLVFAEQESDKCSLQYYFSSAYPVSYTYAEGETLADICVEPLVKNEMFRVLLVRDKRANVVHTTTPSIAIDAAGQIACATCGAIDFAKHETTCEANALGAAWQKIGQQTFITVGNVLGVPYQNYVGTTYGFATTLNATTVSGTGGYFYCYLVALDTRHYDSTKDTFACDGSTSPVAGYAMTQCYYDEGIYNFNLSAQKPLSATNFMVNGKTGVLGSYNQIDFPGRILPWQSCAEIKSLVVDGETLTGDDLADYLTPKVNSMIATAEGLSLTATAPDVQYYTLYTKAKLSDESWVPFEDFVNENENFVDKTIGKRYTRFRIDGKSLSIPQVYGEASRFYMLRGE